MNKQLTLGVVAALSIASGQAYAVDCPTTPTVMSSIFIPGFTCTIGDKTFSDFTTTAVTSNLVAFSESGSDTTLALSTANSGGAGFGSDMRTYGFTVTVDPAAVAAGTRIDAYTLAIGSGPAATTSATIMGSNSGTNSTGPLTGPQTNTLTFSEPDKFNTVSISTTQSNNGNARVNSLTNTFVQSTVPVSVSEPMSLSLFGLGLTGLCFAGRRRRS